MLQSANLGGANEVVFTLKVVGDPNNAAAFNDFKRQFEQAQPWRSAGPAGSTPAGLPQSATVTAAGGAGASIFGPEHAKNVEAAKAGVAAYKEKIALQKESLAANELLNASFKRTATGVAEAARAFAYFGVVSADSMEKAVKGLALVEGSIAAIKGGVSLAQGIGGIYSGMSTLAGQAGGFRNITVGNAMKGLGKANTIGMMAGAFAGGYAAGGILDEYGARMFGGEHDLNAYIDKMRYGGEIDPFIEKQVRGQVDIRQHSDAQIARFEAVNQQRRDLNALTISGRSGIDRALSGMRFANTLAGGDESSLKSERNRQTNLVELYSKRGPRDTPDNIVRDDERLKKLEDATERLRQLDVEMARRSAETIQMKISGNEKITNQLERQLDLEERRLNVARSDSDKMAARWGGLTATERTQAEAAKRDQLAGKVLNIRQVQALGRVDPDAAFQAQKNLGENGPSPFGNSVFAPGANANINNASAEVEKLRRQLETANQDGEKLAKDLAEKMKTVARPYDEKIIAIIDATMQQRLQIAIERFKGEVKADQRVRADFQVR